MSIDRSRAVVGCCARTSHFVTLITSQKACVQTYVVKMNSMDDDGPYPKYGRYTVPCPRQPAYTFIFPLFLLLSEGWGPRQQKDFENDFITNTPSHYDYIRKLQQWRQKFEVLLDARPRLQPLALLSHCLTLASCSTSTSQPKFTGTTTGAFFWFLWS
jgi:hypothetical protein